MKKILVLLVMFLSISTMYAQNTFDLTSMIGVNLFNSNNMIKNDLEKNKIKYEIINNGQGGKVFSILENSLFINDTFKISIIDIRKAFNKKKCICINFSEDQSTIFEDFLGKNANQVFEKGSSDSYQNYYIFDNIIIRIIYTNEETQIILFKSSKKIYKTWEEVQKKCDELFYK